MKQKWIVADELFDEAWKAAEEITDNLDDEPFDEMLRDCYGEVSICGLECDPAIALERVDPVAYRCERYDYYSFLSEDIASDIERMDDGDKQTFYGCEVVCVCDDEEERNELRETAESVGWDVSFFWEAGTYYRPNRVLFTNWDDNDLKFYITYESLDEIPDALYDEFMIKMGSDNADGDELSAIDDLVYELQQLFK